MNKGHPSERQNMSLYTGGLQQEGILFYFITKELLEYGLYLQGGIYSELALNTGLTV